MTPIQIIASDLFDTIRSKFSNLQMGNEDGSVVTDPKDARFFDFDLTFENHKLGRISISINETGNLKLFYGQDIAEIHNSALKKFWYDFIIEMRFFAKRRLLRFDTRDIVKQNLDKKDFAFLANKKKGTSMTESDLYGTSKTSNRKLDNTKLIIRHKEAIDPTVRGSRSRKIENLFIENGDGERFKFPFRHLSGARAMQRHVAAGGYPHDDIGKHIIGTCERILQLSDFGKKVRHASLNNSGHEITERANMKLRNLKDHINALANKDYYHKWKECFNPMDDALLELNDDTTQSYTNSLTQNQFDESFTSLFPLLHTIMSEVNDLDLEDYVSEDNVAENELDYGESGNLSEIDEFHDWSDDVMNETFNDEVLKNLQALVSHEMPIGANQEAIMSLKGIGIHDPELLDTLDRISKMPGGADVDTRTIIKSYLGNDAEKIDWNDTSDEVPSEYTSDFGSGDSNSSDNDTNVDDTDADFSNPTDDMDDQNYTGNMTPPQAAESFSRKLGSWISVVSENIVNGNIQTWRPIAHNLRVKYGISENIAKKMAKELLEFHGVEDEEDFVKRVSGDVKPIDSQDRPDKKTEIKQIVLGFYDREKGTWPKGEHGVVTHVKRYFSNENGEGGDEEAKYAAQLVNKINSQKKNTVSNNQVSDIRKLSGLG